MKSLSSIKSFLHYKSLYETNKIHFETIYNKYDVNLKELFIKYLDSESFDLSDIDFYMNIYDEKLDIMINYLNINEYKKDYYWINYSINGKKNEITICPFMLLNHLLYDCIFT